MSPDYQSQLCNALASIVTRKGCPSEVTTTALYIFSQVTPELLLRSKVGPELITLAANDPNKYNAMKVIMMLVCDSSNEKQLFDDGLLQVLVDALASKAHDQVRAITCKVIGRLSIGDHWKRLDKNSFLLRLCDVANEGSCQVKKEAVPALCNILERLQREGSANRICSILLYPDLPMMEAFVQVLSMESEAELKIDVLDAVRTTLIAAKKSRDFRAVYSNWNNYFGVFEKLTDQNAGDQPLYEIMEMLKSFQEEDYTDENVRPSQCFEDVDTPRKKLFSGTVKILR